MCSKSILRRSLQNLLPSLSVEATSSRLLCLLLLRVEKVRRSKETTGLIPVPRLSLDALFPVSTREILEKQRSHRISLVRDPPWHCFIHLPHNGKLIPGQLMSARTDTLTVLNSNCILPLSDRSQKMSWAQLLYNTGRTQALPVQPARLRISPSFLYMNSSTTERYLL